MRLQNDLKSGELSFFLTSRTKGKCTDSSFKFGYNFDRVENERPFPRNQLLLVVEAHKTFCNLCSFFLTRMQIPIFGYLLTPCLQKKSRFPIVWTLLREQVLFWFLSARVDLGA